MTLDDLHEAFISLKAELIKIEDGCGANGLFDDMTPERAAALLAGPVAPKHRTKLPNRNRDVVCAMYAAARVYLIARDEGMDAAMLWKLQNA